MFDEKFSFCFSCVCTDSHHEPIVQRSRRRRRHAASSRRLNRPELSTTGSTSTHSDSVTDDDHDLSSVSHDEFSKSNVEIFSNNLVKPDLIASISNSNRIEEKTSSTKTFLEKNLLF